MSSRRRGNQYSGNEKVCFGRPDPGVWEGRMSRRLRTEPVRLRRMPRPLAGCSAAPLDRTGTAGDRIEDFGTGRREDPG